MAKSASSKTTGGTDRKRKWYVVLWAHIAMPAYAKFRTIDVSVDAAIARMNAVLSDPASVNLVPLDGVIQCVPHQRGMKATEAGRYDDTFSWDRNEILETIQVPAGAVGVADRRKTWMGTQTLLPAPCRVWVGVLDIETPVSKCDLGILVVPDVMVMGESGQAVANQEALFSAVREDGRHLNISALTVLRDSRLYPAILNDSHNIKYSMRHIEEGGPHIIANDFGRFGSAEKAEDVVRSILIDDDSRDVLILNRG